jgi:hypothetical protein
MKTVTGLVIGDIPQFELRQVKTARSQARPLILDENSRKCSSDKITDENLPLKSAVSF